MSQQQPTEQQKQAEQAISDLDVIGRNPSTVITDDFSLESDAPLEGACDLSGEGTCEACQ